MSLRQLVRLELEDGTEIKVAYDGRDLMAWETKHGKSALTADMSINMLAWLGWAAAYRQGMLNGSFGTFEKFSAVCVDVAGVRDEPDPSAATKKGASRKAASEKS